MPVWPEIEQPDFIGNDAVYTNATGTLRGPIRKITWVSKEAFGCYVIAFEWIAKPTPDGGWVMVHPTEWKFDATPRKWSDPELTPDGGTKFTFLPNPAFTITFLAGTTPNLDCATIRAAEPPA